MDSSYYSVALPFDCREVLFLPTRCWAAEDDRSSPVQIAVSPLLAEDSSQFVFRIFEVHYIWSLQM